MTKTPAPGQKSHRDTVGGPVGKTFDILELVTRSPTGSASVTEIAETLAIPRPTANRIVSNLVKQGMLKRDVATTRLIEGDRLLALALSTMQGAAKRGPRHEILSQLAIETRETCNIGVLTGARVTYVDRVEAAWPLALRLEVGSHVPLYCSAIGKLLLSRLSPQQQNKYLTTIPLVRHTPHTITDPAALSRELDDIAQHGVSCDHGECFEGVLGLAVAIETGSGAPVLGLSIAAPSARVTMEDLRKHLPLMQDAADRLRRCFGG